jgi:glycosyltransferase involved in cell wall biosynthesis
MTAPTVSVVLPTFNRLKYLRGAVDSVLAQTFQDWELILADDGSEEEETVVYLAALENHPRVKLLRLLHTGNPAAVRNAALRVAAGQYVAFLDSDDMWLPAKLDIQVAHRRCSERRWSYSALTRVGKSGELMHDDTARRWVPHEGCIFEQLLTLEATVATPSVLVDRSLLEQVGGFDEQQLFFEEYDLWLRLSLRSEVSALSEPLVLVRSHDEHYTRDRVGVYEARSRLLEKMGGLVATERLRCILRLAAASNSTELAKAYAICGRSTQAFKMLWRARKCAWQGGKWWRTAATVMGRAIVPLQVQGLVRGFRRKHQAWTGGHV